MTPQQQELVRKSFTLIKPRADEVADLLYKKLFELEPKVAALFRGEMNDQKEKLMRMLQIAVERIDNHAELQPMLFNLGRIHRSYGIEGHQFMSFQESLLFALRTVLGKEFTKEVEDAWKAVYVYLASTMYNFPHSDDTVQVPHH
ncbi:MAG: globin domain-containing protein [Bacteroidota bacterium]